MEKVKMFFTSVDQLKNVLYVRGYDDQGLPTSYKTKGEDMELKLFVKDKNGTSSKKTLFGESLKELEFSSISELAEFRNDFRKELNLQGDFLISNQYITQNKLADDVDLYSINCGTIDIETTSARKKYTDKQLVQVQNKEKLTIKQINELTEKDIIVWDEERNDWKSFATSCYNDVIGGFPQIDNPLEQIIVISVHSSKTKLITCFTLCPEQEINFPSCDLKMFFCQTEKELLIKFIDYWKKEAFDVITGWSSSYFDLPYLYNRMCLAVSKKEADCLSFWKNVNVRTIDKMNKKTTLVELLGTPHLDYIDLYKKFVSSPRENYKLDTICEIELKEKKLGYSEYVSIQEFWEKDPLKFTLYNIQDTYLVVKLESKLKLLFLALTFAYISKQNYSDIFSPVKTWESLCYNQLFENNKVVPPMAVTGKDESFAGAFVRDAVSGMYKDVVTYDLKSLYPSIIQMLNISPETLVNKIVDNDIQNENLVEDLLNQKLVSYDSQHKNNLTLSANGQFYSKTSKGIIPTIMEDLGLKRDLAKQRMIELEKELELVKSQLEQFND